MLIYPFGFKGTLALKIVVAAAVALRKKSLYAFKRTVSDSELRKGDVIGVHRIGILYDHYGIYTGNNEVIHFSDEGGDFGDDTCIRRTTLTQFKDGASNVFVVYFKNEFTVYSPEETVKKAKSLLGKGKDKYSLLTNNCEHFTTWCKTGKHESSQVPILLEAAAWAVNRGISPADMILEF